MTSLAFQQVREVGAVTAEEDVTMTCSCKIQFYIILALSISILGLVIFAVLHSRNYSCAEDFCSQSQSKLCYLFLMYNIM